MKLFHSPAYTAAAHGFDTTRKAAWVAGSLASEPLPGVELVAPAPLTEADLLRVHAPAYVRAVRTGEPRELAESQGFTWDPALWDMVCASNGGMVAAALAAWRTGGTAGSLSSGLHHAHREHGLGFCTFNGLALAADAALRAGAKRILILDLDAHGGGGTAELISGWDGVWQSDLAVSTFESYPDQERIRLRRLVDGAGYLRAVGRELARIAEEWPTFDLCLYNAGMDPHEDCTIGGWPGITAGMLAERERLVFAWCRRRGLPVAFALAGGYISGGLSQPGLVALHRATISAAAG